MRHEGQIDPKDSLPQVSPTIDISSASSAAEQAGARLRTEANTGMITKAEMTKVAGLWDWLFGKKQDDTPKVDKDGFYVVPEKPSTKVEPSNSSRPVEDYRTEPHKTEEKLEDPHKPSADAIKVFEEKKAEIKQACEAAYGAGNEKCDDSKPAPERQGIVSGDRSSSSSHNNNSGFSNALLWWWILSSNNRTTTTAPNYYDHKPSSDRNNFVGSGGTMRPGVTSPKPADSPPASNAGKNPVTGIPNTGKPSGFGGTGGARPGGSVGGGSRGGSVGGG
ncbi:MAG: hypothetical protein K2X77_21615 [Candidatus Obscuribacterales bacterium]|jgi:hypothetical protein|nr:hypothetical protein [Candidatus Obscuribacterales bacterium]